MSDKYRLSRKLANISLAVYCDPEIHIPDFLTKIRILPTISVVGQTDKVMRTETGDTVVDIFVKFMPISDKTYDNIVSVCELIKSLPGVSRIRVDKLDGKDVTYKGSKILIWIFYPWEIVLKKYYNISVKKIFLNYNILSTFNTQNGVKLLWKKLISKN